MTRTVDLTPDESWSRVPEIYAGGKLFRIDARLRESGFTELLWRGTCTQEEADNILKHFKRVLYMSDITMKEESSMFKNCFELHCTEPNVRKYRVETEQSTIPAVVCLCPLLPLPGTILKDSNPPLVLTKRDATPCEANPMMWEIRDEYGTHPDPIGGG